MLDGVPIAKPLPRRASQHLHRHAASPLLPGRPCSGLCPPPRVSGPEEGRDGFAVPFVYVYTQGLMPGCALTGDRTRAAAHSNQLSSPVRVPVTFNICRWMPAEPPHTSAPLIKNSQAGGSDPDEGKLTRRECVLYICTGNPHTPHTQRGGQTIGLQL